MFPEKKEGKRGRERRRQKRGNPITAPV